ncbi:TRAP transporter small permease [Paenibacillus agricola]|uniref:TRAP transporter small permease n=1 Tax=Paenibacillus agricola TaxID=2716264 RepID=A0ABX0JFG2_9BACL|nr:TRAP transporter small permease [Paenibacillus agricola]NHN33433.1 TRAP transporter small permease [Paenibacillus agricola]
MSDKPARRNILSFITDALDKCLVGISILVGAVLTINIIVAVFFRYVLNSPIYWADELSLYLFCWATFLGAALAVKRSDMAAVTFFLNRLSGRANILLSMLIQLCMLFFSIIIGYYSIIWISSPSVMNLLSPALSMNMWKLYTIVPISMFCMAVFSIEHLIGFIPSLFGKRGGTAQ